MKRKRKPEMMLKKKVMNKRLRVRSRRRKLSTTFTTTRRRLGGPTKSRKRTCSLTSWPTGTSSGARALGHPRRRTNSPLRTGHPRKVVARTRPRRTKRRPSSAIRSLTTRARKMPLPVNRRKKNAKWRSGRMLWRSKTRWRKSTRCSRMPSRTKLRVCYRVSKRVLQRKAMDRRDQRHLTLRALN